MVKIGVQEFALRTKLTVELFADSCVWELFCLQLELFLPTVGPVLLTVEAFLLTVGNCF